MRELKDEIVLWLRQQVHEANAGGLVVGMSGGLDSTVVAVLAREAVGEKLLGLLLPCQSSRDDLTDAQAVSDIFHIHYKIIDLTPIYEVMARILPLGSLMARANLKPRIRMTVLYYFANNHNYLVVGTGNKSELMTGYFTKYGDGGVDLLPLGGLLKTEVRELASVIGIPERIIAKIPSAGLWEGQSDEEELGMPYEELDRALCVLLKAEKEDVSSKALERVRDLMAVSAHKRMTAKVFTVTTDR